MDIRLIKEDDARLLVPIFDAYRQFYEQASDEAGALAYLTQHLEAGDCFGVIAVDDKGVAAGFGLIFPTFSSVRLQTVWILNDFFVVPKARGTRLASRLMVRLFASAEERNIGQISLITHNDNTRAQRHYKKMGWKQSEFLRFEREIRTNERSDRRGSS
jgi:GNAT superfamily N-acetyltransferase